MPESVNCWMPIPGPAGQLFHADSHAAGGQCEAPRKLPALLHLVDRAVCKRHHLPELMPADGASDRSFDFAAHWEPLAHHGRQHFAVDICQYPGFRLSGRLPRPLRRPDQGDLARRAGRVPRLLAPGAGGSVTIRRPEPLLLGCAR